MTLTGPSGLRLEDVASPVCGPDELLVDVCATALNRADLLQTKGLYPAPPGAPPDIPGLEYAGEVASVGARVTRWKVGDRVMGLVAGGAWAQRLVTHQHEALPVPTSVDLTRAAAIPEAFTTAFDALVLQGGLTVGSRVLIHAVTSGVGTAALQLCRAYGAKAIGTGRSPQKLERARMLGLADTVLVTAEARAFAREVLRLTHDQGCDLVLDLVGGDWLAESLEAMAPRGTLVLIGLLAGATAKVPLAALLTKRLHLVGTTLRSRALDERIAVARHVERRVLPLFEHGTLEPVVESVSSVRDLVPALERLAANETFGKVVLTW